jgi:hypothetical protein
MATDEEFSERRPTIRIHKKPLPEQVLSPRENDTRAMDTNTPNQCNTTGMFHTCNVSFSLTVSYL